VASSRDIWRSLSPLSKALAVGGVVAAIGGTALIGTVAAQRPQTAAPLPNGPTSPPLPPTASPDTLAAATASASPTPTPTPTPAGADPLLGTDGRLTVLLLGSDYRPAHPGNRTDAILVVSVDPTTGESAGFSIPRDVSGFPLPTKGTFNTKVNGLYQYLESHGGNGGKQMKAAIRRAFGIEVDFYALIGFSGVKDLVNVIGGVDVTLANAYYDPHYWVTARHQGWGLPAGRSHLDGKNALIFARSRKGDNDFGRAARQQQLILAALDKVRHRGPDNVAALVRIARDEVRTDLPLARALDLYKLFGAVNLARVDRVVFGPRTYAAAAGGTSYRLRLEACRAWIAAHFPKARPLGLAPVGGPAGSPTPTPSVAPSPAP
jgi:polyisoprenyl-teichoic acid--peptidoglycan teichoic acid transferase